MRLHLIAAIVLGLQLLVQSCHRPEAPEEPAAGGGEEAERLALERWQLDRERGALEAGLAAFERELNDQGQAALASSVEVQRQWEELADRERELARQEQELAGREVVAAAAELVAAPVAEPAEMSVEPAFNPNQGLGESAEPDWIAENPVADFGTFYDELEPHGDWFEADDYGYVWRPTVVVQVNAWRPYYDGRWAWTDCGWTWVSNEPFGWATYHYGRWTLLPGHGWVWVPGHRWAPAWVSWRQGGGHIGWAPLPPECADGVRPIWGSGVEREFGIGSDWYCFVDINRFTAPVAGNCLPRRDNDRLCGATTNITLIREQHGRVTVGGPDYQDLCRRIGHRVPQLQLDLDRSGSGRHGGRVSGARLQMVAPAVGAGWNALLRPQHMAGRIEGVEDPRRSQMVVAGAVERLRQARESQRQEAERRYPVSAGEDLLQKREQWLAGHRQQLESARHERLGGPDQGPGTVTDATVSGGVLRLPPVPEQVDRQPPPLTGGRVLPPAGRPETAGGRTETMRRGATVPGEGTARTRGDALSRRQEEAETARDEAPQRMRGQTVPAAGRPETPTTEGTVPGVAGLEEVKRRQAEARERLAQQAGAQQQAREEAMREQAEQARERQAQQDARKEAMGRQQDQAAEESAKEVIRRQQTEARERLAQQAEAQQQAREAAMREQAEQARERLAQQAEAQQQAREAAMREQAEQARERQAQQAAAQQQAREAAMREQAEQQARERQAQQAAAQQQAREAAMREQAEQARQAREEAQRRQQEELGQRQEELRRRAEEQRRQTGPERSGRGR